MLRIQFILVIILITVGLTGAAAAEPLYAADQVMIRFSRPALQQSGLDRVMGRNASTPSLLTGLSDLDATIRTLGGKHLRRPYALPNNGPAVERLGIDRWFKLEFDGPVDIETVTRALQEDPRIEYATPNYYAYPTVIPNDPLHTSHWGHNNTTQLPAYDWGGTYAHTGPLVGTVDFDARAEAAWSLPQGYGDPSVVIAIIDGGVDLLHPDLNLVAGYDFGDDDATPHDDAPSPGHGTACAGIAAAIADNDIGVAGIAGGCSIMPLKVEDSSGHSSFSEIQSAFYYAADNGADIVSMSMSVPGITSDPATDAALQYCYEAGVTIFSSVGNLNADALNYPANSPYIMGVGAASPCGGRKRSSDQAIQVNPGVNTDPNGCTCDGETFWGSNYGVDSEGDPLALEIMGPTILPTTDITGGGGYTTGSYYDFFNGTSCATPYVAGVAALLKSQNPDWTPAQIRAQITSTATDVVNVESGIGWDRYSGYGLVNAENAIYGSLGNAAPMADFNGGPTSGCSPLVVNFVDQSAGSPTSWFWDFGDGNTSTEQNPQHTYYTGVDFDVTLIAINAAGADTIVKAGFMTVDESIANDFIADVTSGYAPMTVNFTDTSSGSPTSWIWIFGDGGNAFIQNPSHVYDTPGQYTVTMNASDACGYDILSKPAYITVLDGPAPVVADFVASVTYGGAPLSVGFTDLTTGDPTSWLWDFGDTGTGTQQNPTHLYTDPGLYTVTLSVGNGVSSDVMTRIDYIDIPAYSAVQAAPARFALRQSYPNPFNPSTVISFSLPVAHRARLEIFDSAGRRVAVLLDELKSPGDHEVVWTPSQKPSGVYFARLSAGEQSAVTRLVLLK
jgi:PKD repeat protein